MCAEVLRTKRLVRGSHAGGFDAFVPISMGGDIVAIFVVGPFSLERSSAAEIRERWRTLTERDADLADPEFATYLEMTLSTLVLPGEQASRLERMLECLAQLMGACGKADELTNEIYALRLELEKSRLADRMWSAVAGMLNESSFRGQYSAAVHHDLAQLGLARPADQVLVGLSVDRSPSADPVDGAIRRDTLQRAAVELARADGNVAAGKVGDNGIVFLSAERGGSVQRKKKLEKLGRSAFLIARDKLGLSLHFGTTELPETIPHSSH